MRFDVYPVRDRLSPFFVDVQAELVENLPSRVIIPLQRLEGAKNLIGELNPVFEVAGGRYVLATHALVSIPKQMLRKPVASLAAHQAEITRALDILLTGF